MEFGLIPLPFGWSDSELGVFHRNTWIFGWFVNLLAMLWCVTIANDLQTKARRDHAPINDHRYTKAKFWFGGGVLLLMAIFLYPVLGLYMFIPIIIALGAVPFFEIFLGLCLVGYLIIGEIYCTLRTIKNPNWR